MRWSLASLVLVLGWIFLGGYACNDYNCRGACLRVYGDPPNHCGATHLSIPDNADAISQCVADCQNALYNEGTDEGEAGVEFTDEQSATEFINCVFNQVDPTSPDCASKARAACGASAQ
jgi:hypothetical protein